MYYRAYGIIILFLSTIAFIEANCQLTADAGKDTIYCASNLDDITLGGNPTAIGGTPPYKYSWSCELRIRTHIFYATSFLNDTTVSNPTFKSPHDTLTFYLTVTDSLGGTGKDSVTVQFSEFVACLGQCKESIDQGDSVQLSHCIAGGIPPYTHNWLPAESLSDPAVGNPWAKPATTTTYELTLTDSAGCETQSNCQVTVTPKHYEPTLVKENRLWSNTELGTEHGHPYHSYYIKFEGDATINNVQYKKILKSEDEAHTNWKLHGYIREDSSKKVYIYDDYFKTDLLLYDFGLQVGDSIMPPDSFQYVYVCDISYVTFEQSTDTFKQIMIYGRPDCSRHEISWIEGIGSSGGVLNGLTEYMICCVELNLVCYYDNDTLKYHNSYFNNCFPQGFPEGVDERVDESYGITVYPNPFTDQLTIEGLPYKIMSFEVYDIHGRLIFQDNEYTASSHTINTSDYKPGLYLLRVGDAESGQTITSKIVVKR